LKRFFQRCQVRSRTGAALHSSFGAHPRSPEDCLREAFGSLLDPPPAVHGAMRTTALEKAMQCILSFDVEIWCNDWARLDAEFPEAFIRYIYGGSREHGGALPLTLAMLERYGLRGTFFVEPLFAARFGREYLREVVDLIGSRGHDIQLHLHSEWADEIDPRPLPHIEDKRQHLQYLDRTDQNVLIRLGLDLLHDAGVEHIRAFRAGSFAANADTFRSLVDVHIPIDSSINAAEPLSVPDMRGVVEIHEPSIIEGVRSIPLTVFRDGFGRLRPAQVGSCSFMEMKEFVCRAVMEDRPVINILSHNFEMLRPGSTKTDPIVTRRFEELCTFLASHPEVIVTTYDAIPASPGSREPLHVGAGATLRRMAEQLARRALPA